MTTSARAPVDGPERDASGDELGRVVAALLHVHRDGQRRKGVLLEHGAHHVGSREERRKGEGPVCVGGVVVPVALSRHGQHDTGHRFAVLVNGSDCRGTQAAVNKVDASGSNRRHTVLCRRLEEVAWLGSCKRVRQARVQRPDAVAAFLIALRLRHVRGEGRRLTAIWQRAAAGHDADINGHAGQLDAATHTGKVRCGTRVRAAGATARTGGETVPCRNSARRTVVEGSGGGQRAVPT